MPSTASVVRVLRSLTPERRTELLARLEHPTEQISSTRCFRQIEILRRHIFSNEPVALLRGNLGISKREFHAERREALIRAARTLEESSARPAISAVVRRARGLLAHARSLYGLGLSEQALRVLEEISDGALEAPERLETILLTVDVFNDLVKVDQFSRLADRAHVWLANTPHTSREYELAGVGADWTRAQLCYYRGDRNGFSRAWSGLLDTLRRRSIGGERESVKTFCRLWNSAMPNSNDWISAESGLREAQELARRFQLPLAIEAELRAFRAFIYLQDSSTVSLGRSELETAHALAVEHAPPRVSWWCLCFDVYESLYREDRSRALESASMLFEDVRHSESVDWKRIAASRLVNAYLSLGRLDDAERLVTLDGEQGSSAELTFGRCVVSLKRGHYAESYALACELIDRFDAPTIVRIRANVLLHRAQAARALGDVTQARRDIEETIDIYESHHAPTLFALRDAYLAAHEITGDVLYRNRALELMPASYANVPALRHEVAGIGLTPRQREIAWLAADGATNREIAERLGLSHRTVGNHLEAVFTYFGIHGIHARRELATALRANAH